MDISASPADGDLRFTGRLRLLLEHEVHGPLIEVVVSDAYVRQDGRLLLSCAVAEEEGISAVDDDTDKTMVAYHVDALTHSLARFSIPYAEFNEAKKLLQSSYTIDEAVAAPRWLVLLYGVGLVKRTMYSRGTRTFFLTPLGRKVVEALPLNEDANADPVAYTLDQLALDNLDGDAIMGLKAIKKGYSVEEGVAVPEWVKTLLRLGLIEHKYPPDAWPWRNGRIDFLLTTLGQTVYGWLRG